MLAVLRYGYGLPMNRMAQLQEDFGVPVPSGTQWELIDEHFLELGEVYEGFLRDAADGEIFFNDDTPVKILTVQKQIREDENRPADERNPRTGVFTTGIVVKKAEHTLTLFFSGRRHAGETLQALLDRRSSALDAPIQMCDGLDRNVPGTTLTLLANCNTHGRRGFVEVADAFPEECAYVLETIQQVYARDQQAKTEHLSPEQRLALLLQNRKGCARGRFVHESNPHLPSVSHQSLRLSHHSQKICPQTPRRTHRVDAVELSSHRGGAGSLLTRTAFHYPVISFPRPLIQNTYLRLPKPRRRQIRARIGQYSQARFAFTPPRRQKNGHTRSPKGHEYPSEVY